MLYHLLFPLREIWFPFNLFQYITFRASGALLTALAICFVLGPPLIRRLKAAGIGQRIRPDGPAHHRAKAGTPTMGGLLILAALLVSTLLWARWDNRYTWIILGTTAFLGLLGFLDDWLKHRQNDSRGLPMHLKMGGLLAAGLALAAWLYLDPPNPAYRSSVHIPYTTIYLEIGAAYILLALLVFLGSSNSVNLTDGLDGLAVGCIVIAALAYLVFTYVAGHAKFAQYLRIVPVPGSGELSVFLAAMIGAGLGFLWFNAPPAEVFMGDTGSLFLGGSLGTVALLCKQELILVVVAGVFVAEAASVLLQVWSYRRRGKRVFRMAPLHHHFELSGWAEPKVVIRFWILAIFLALIALSSLKIR